MDSVSANMIAQSVEAMNRIIKTAQAQQLDLAKNMIAMTTEIKVNASIEQGKGAILDRYA